MSATPGRVVADPPPGPGPRPLTVTGLLLLDPLGHDPTVVDSITFDDGGIGVVRSRGEAARVLPWSAVVDHAVEPWAGGVIPGWWIGPGAGSAGRSGTPGADAPDRPDALDGLLSGSHRPARPLPHAEAGAMISIQTRTGTYRFLRAGGDPSDLARRVAEFAVRHRGAAGVSTVTTVASDRRRPRSRWARVRPWLVALLVIVIATAVTLILLQSAGMIHLPVLGSGTVAGDRAPARWPPV